jgi:threonyl-tRNA synthetase
VSDVRVTVDGSERVVATGTTAAELFEDDRSVIAARVAGALRDLSSSLVDGDVVEPVRIDSEEWRLDPRLACAHVMAQAVQELYPRAKLGIGPPSPTALLLRLRRRRAVPSRRPQAHREAHAGDRQGGQAFVRRKVTTTRRARSSRPSRTSSSSSG